MKKILSLVLALMMVFSVVPAVFAADTVTSAQASDYQDAIDFLSTIGFYQAGGHADDELVTRWQMALFIARALTGKTDNAYWATTENNSGFADIDEYLNADESYKVGAISYAKNVGIINGYGDGNFGPNDGITYRDALTMAVRALGINYPAAGYPWSYVTKADELGLMDGIVGVGQTEELTRGEVAQILYNALNAEVNGTTLAEKTFGVGEMIVMITASKNVAYDGSTKVARDGYVQFSAIDEQGEPTGAKYHIPYAKFGFADAAAADAAVGVNYAIVYKNNCTDVISAEALWTTYENFGATGTKEIAVASGKITLGGVQTTLVDKYTADLYNGQVYGVNETKVFGSATAASIGTTIGSVYYMDAQGYIYEIATLNIVAYYFDFFDTIYAVTVEANGKYTYAPISAQLKNAIIADLGSTTTPVGPVAVANAALATSNYTKAVASDSNADGVYDRVAVKNYSFGYYDLSSDAKNATLYKKSGLNALATADGTYAVGNVTGVKPTKDSYVIYYKDAITGKVDISVVVDADKADKTYYATAYVLGFSVANSVLYMQDTKADRFDLAFGYADTELTGSPLYAFSTAASAATANAALIDELLAAQGQYVTYVVVDGRIVYFEAANESNNYVVIDHFTSITKDGIIAHAYSTVTDEYADIKIAEFEGWNIGGFDWNELWLEIVMNSIWTGTNPGSASDYLANLLPIKADQLYKVIYENDGAYNLREVTAADVVDTANAVSVIKEKIHWFKDNDPVQFTTASAIAAFTQTSSAHNWLVIQAPKDQNGEYDLTAIEEVYVVPGKIADMIIPAFDLYKMADNDFVIVADEYELEDFIYTQVVGSNYSVVYYQKYDLAGQDHNNAWADQTIDTHYYWMWMRDVLTGTATLVKIDIAEWAAIRAKLDDLGNDSALLVLVDGVLTLAGGELPIVDMSVVAELYYMAGNTNVIDAYYDDPADSRYTGYVAMTADNFAKQVGNILDCVVMDYQGYIVDQDYYGAANITFIGLDAAGKYVKTVGKASGRDVATTASFGALQNVETYIFWNEATGKAVVFVNQDI